MLPGDRGTPDQKAISVVLVDDHQMFAESLSRLLENVPDISVVATAATGEQGLAAVRNMHPDIVLMDYELPDYRGTDLAAKLIAQRPGTRVVMLTGATDGSVVAAAIAAGCSGYVTKTRAADDLVAAIRRAQAGDLVMPLPEETKLGPRLATEDSASTPVSARELEVLQLMAAGLSTSAMADRLYVSTHTVRNHVQHILSKLGAHSKLEAVSVAVRSGLIYYH